MIQFARLEIRHEETRFLKIFYGMEGLPQLLNYVLRD